MDDYNVDLVLTGHTHGGQLFPIHLWHLVREPYFVGLYKHKSGSQVYVSSGVHFWGMPMRLWSEAEITHVTLTTSWPVLLLEYFGMAIVVNWATEGGVVDLSVNPS